MKQERSVLGFIIDDFVTCRNAALRAKVRFCSISVSTLYSRHDLCIVSEAPARIGSFLTFYRFFIVALLFMTPNAAFAEILALNTADEAPLSTVNGTGHNDLIIREAFRRIGHQIKILHLPSERALVNANKGIDDGNFVRIAGLEKIYPNLVRVPESITAFEFAAFAKDPSIRIRDWDSLEPYNVGIITGWKILEANIVGTRSLTKVSDPTALFKLLAGDSVDLVVFDRRQGNAFLRNHGLSGIMPLTPLLARQEMYLYLNRSHTALVPKLAEALRKMKRDGTFDRTAGSVIRDK